MPLRIDDKAGEVTFALSTRIYDREAVELAARVFAPKAKAFLESEDAGLLSLTLKLPPGATRSELEAVAGDFMNEALNQDLRLELARKNGPILKLQLARALSSARGGNPRGGGGVPGEPAE